MWLLEVIHSVSVAGVRLDMVVVHQVPCAQVTRLQHLLEHFEEELLGRRLASA